MEAPLGWESLDLGGTYLEIWVEPIWGEQRINLLGWLRDRVVHMTYTERGEALHIISLREATKHEVRYYFKAVSDEA